MHTFLCVVVCIISKWLCQARVLRFFSRFVLFCFCWKIFRVIYWILIYFHVIYSSMDVFKSIYRKEDTTRTEAQCSCCFYFVMQWHDTETVRVKWEIGRAINSIKRFTAMAMIYRIRRRNKRYKRGRVWLKFDQQISTLYTHSFTRLIYHLHHRYGTQLMNL